MKHFGINAIVALGGLAFFVLAPHAHAAGPDTAPAQAAASTDVGTLLTPLLAAATGIERVVEMIWNWVESAAPKTVATLGMGQGWAQYAHDEVIRWETRLNHLAGQSRELMKQPGAVEADPAKTSVLARDIEATQQKLLDAQQQIQTGIKSPRYVGIKQSGSVLIGLIMGLVTSFTTGLDLFKILGLSATAGVFGIVITGLIIGAGSGPVHSIIGLLQQARDLTDQAANLFSSRSRQNATQALATMAGVNANAAAGAAAAAASSARDLGPAGPVAPAPPPLPVVTPEQIRAIERLARR